MDNLFNINDIDFEKAYEYALKLLDYSPQTERMLINKMKNKRFSFKIIKMVIEKLTENNLIRDYEISSIYADNLVKNKYLGFASVILKLKLKGIDRNLAEKIAKEAIQNNGGEEEIIKKYIEKHSRLINELILKKEANKIKDKLIKNGFSLNIINKTIKEFDL